MIIRKDTEIRLPVRCIDNTGAGVVGLLPADITDGTTVGNVTIVKGDSTIDSIALVNAVNWIEIDALAAPGLYHVVVPNTHTDVVGTLQLSVLPSAALFLATVITAQVESLANDNELIRKITTNRWKVYTSGIDINRLVIFDDDETTPILKFDLKDAASSPTTTNPFERDPV